MLCIRANLSLQGTSVYLLSCSGKIKRVRTGFGKIKKFYDIEWNCQVRLRKGSKLSITCGSIIHEIVKRFNNLCIGL